MRRALAATCMIMALGANGSAADFSQPSLAQLTEPRASHTATLLPDGTVLLTGGRGGVQSTLDGAEIFDSATLQSNPVHSPLLTARRNHTATLLPTGDIGLNGGQDDAGILITSEVITPAGTVLELDAGLEIPRVGHTATLLPDGRVLVLGGRDPSTVTVREGEEFAAPSGLLYDSSGGTFEVLDQILTVPRAEHTATLLPNGLILVIGGRQDDEVLDSAELVDPRSGNAILLEATLELPRMGHSASLLNDGTVLVAGGRTTVGLMKSMELFDPRDRTFTELEWELSRPRAHHTAAVGPTGKIVFAGGQGLFDLGATAARTVEVHHQPEPDTLPPAVRTISPVHRAMGVELAPLISVLFSEPLNVTTVTNRTIHLSGPTGPVSGLVTPGEEGLLAFFLPSAPLELGATYTLTAQGLRDRAGNQLDRLVSSFITRPPPPTITGFAPFLGVEGTTVTITGTSFDAEAENNRVDFNGRVARVTAATSGRIIAIVPEGATTGPVTVTTDGGTATSDGVFGVLTRPDIQEVRLRTAP